MSFIFWQDIRGLNAVRDMFISLPGLTLAIDEVAKFEMVMETARKAIHDFINDEPDDVKVYEMEHPDVLLWAVWCIQQYAKMVSRDQCREKYGTLLQDIMEYLRRENHPNLFAFQRSAICQRHRKGYHMDEFYRKRTPCDSSYRLYRRN